MKRLLVVLITLTLGLALSACGGSAEPATPADLSGDWSAKEPISMWATITEDEISVYWFDEAAESKSLYWAGSYTPPTEPGEFSWTSINDKDQTDSALLASGVDEKVFTYKDGEISYSVTRMGTTSTVRLKRVNG